MLKLPLRVTVISALFLSLLAGCGSVDPTGGGGGAASAVCAGKEICAEVFIESCCGSDCGVPADVPCDNPTFASPAHDQIDAALCVLEAGRDRTVGSYRVHYNLSTGSDGAPTTTTIVNLGDGFASTQVTSVPSTGAVENPAQRRAFRPKAFFDDCLASPIDGRKLLACVLEMNDSNPVDGLSCPP